MDKQEKQSHGHRRNTGKNGMKYLGIWFEDTRDIFKTHKENKIRLAERLANNTHSVLMRSCNRLIVGKAYWKCVALPAIIYGSGVIIWNKKEQEKLQLIQNKVCRKMLNAPRWATNAATRGDIGISNMDTRLAQNRLGYATNRLREGNGLIKKVVEELITKGSWKKDINAYCQTLGIQNITALSHYELKKKLRKWDTESWKKEMEKKKTLSIYRARKEEVKEEVYYNDRRSEIWFQARSNCLPLRNRAREESKTCKICHSEEEDINHFMLHCMGLSTLRNKTLELQKPNIEDEAKIIGDYLFEAENIPKKKDTLFKMWTKRTHLLKDTR